MDIKYRRFELLTKKKELIGDTLMNVIRLLVSDLGQHSDFRPTISVVPIYRTAGIGKLTLAQMVYMDPRINSYFNFKVWVTLTSHCSAQ